LASAAAGYPNVTINFSATSLSSRVLLLQQLQPLHLRRHQPAILLAPLIVGLDRDAHLAANLLDRITFLRLVRMNAVCCSLNRERFIATSPLVAQWSNLPGHSHLQPSSFPGSGQSQAALKVIEAAMAPALIARMRQQVAELSREYAALTWLIGRHAVRIEGMYKLLQLQDLAPRNWPAMQESERIGPALDRVLVALANVIRQQSCRRRERRKRNPTAVTQGATRHR
jgi:hypothetical protein